MKKWSKSIAAIALASVLAVTGCSNNGDNANSGAAEADSAEKVVTLKLWGAVPEENGPAAVVDKWNAANPNIQVEYVRYINDDSGNTKLDTALMTTSDAPDLFFSYGENNLYRRVNAGMTTPLNELIQTSGFDLEGVIGSENIIKIDDQIHYLPGYKNIDFVVLNKTALDEAGEAVPTSWTWDEFADLALKLTTDTRKGAFVTPGADMLIGKFTLVSSQPKDAFYTADGKSNLNHPAMQKGLEIQKKLYDEKAMVSWGEGIANKLDPANELLTGKAAMVYGGAWMMRSLKDTETYPRDFEVAFAPAPQYEAGTNVNNGGMNDFMSVNANSKYQEEAFQFMSWYMQEGVMDMVPGGRIPTNKSADFDQVTQLVVGDKQDVIDEQSLAAVLKGEYTFAVREVSTAFPQITNITKEEAERYFMDQQTVEETLQAMQQRADEAIEREAE